jgi:hypothetical protein
MTSKEEAILILEEQRAVINHWLKIIRKQHNEEPFELPIIFQKYLCLHSFCNLKPKELLQNECRFSHMTDTNLEMLVKPLSNLHVSKELGLKEIRDFTKDCTELIVIDPYLYGGSSEVSQAYVDDFAKSARINGKNLKKLTLIYSSKHGNTAEIKNEIKKLAKVNKINLISKDTDKIHDRIWIKDLKTGITVGTSLGSIGKRLCFILELPEYDLKALIEFLRLEKLM